MSVFERDLGQTLHAVADSVSLKPEEEQGILAAMRAELARAEHLTGAPRATWRWLSATLVSVLMMISMAGPWQQAPAVMARACITPQARATPLPSVDGGHPEWTGAERAASATPMRPDAHAAPRAASSAPRAASSAPGAASSVWRLVTVAPGGVHLLKGRH